MAKKTIILKTGAQWIGLVRYAWRITFNDYNGWEDSSLDEPINKQTFITRLLKCKILADPARFGRWELIKQ